jgi:hypothetical protein
MTVLYRSLLEILGTFVVLGKIIGEVGFSIKAHNVGQFYRCQCGNSGMIQGALDSYGYYASSVHMCLPGMI